MGINNFQGEICRPREHLIAIGKLYPGAWRQYDTFRQDRGSDGLPDWPDWCYCPLAGAYAIVSGGGDNRVPLQMMGDVARLGALAAWRVTQGIYRFDDDLRDSLLDTPLTGNLPCEALHRMPEWCVYVETPGRVWSDSPLHGFFAHMEYDPNNGREELRLLLDGEDGTTPLPVHLGSWPLEEAVARAIDVSRVHATAMGVSIHSGLRREIEQSAEPLVSLLLYLCADEAEIGTGDARPTNPAPKRTKQGWRLFQADQPAVWDVGVRLGAALRSARASHEESKERDARDRSAHARPRPHIRRAHWHTFRVGEGRADRRLKWLPPIPVNLRDQDDLPSVVRPVKG